MQKARKIKLGKERHPYHDGGYDTHVDLSAPHLENHGRNHRVYLREGDGDGKKDRMPQKGPIVACSLRLYAHGLYSTQNRTMRQFMPPQTPPTYLDRGF
jgi:hypothetical protein